MSKETYLVTFEITSNTNPGKWDWDNFLNLDEGESYYIHSIGQVTRNNIEPLCGDHIQPIRECGCLL